MVTAMKAGNLGITALLGLGFATAPWVVAQAAPLQVGQVQTPVTVQGTGGDLSSSITSQITAAINSGNSQTLSKTIRQLIAANPSLAGPIAEFAVNQDSKDAPIIAAATAEAVRAQGGDPAAIIVALLADVEAQILPGGPGAPGQNNDAQLQPLLNQVITQVQSVVPLTQAQLRELAVDVNILIQYTPPPAFLPPAPATSVPAFSTQQVSPTKPI